MPAIEHNYPTKLVSRCHQAAVYYSDDHDNFYCSLCRKGQGQEFYETHIVGFLETEPFRARPLSLTTKDTPSQ
jgi:hypothetical protein